jgi:glutamyl-tRNA reductase
MSNSVVVIGAGRMGSALATALFHKGFSTTVWNRTGAKTEGLAKLGVRVAKSVEEAVREGIWLLSASAITVPRDTHWGSLTLSPPSEARWWWN